ncbi:aspartate aminotransferase, mitochondrial-like [Oppia nitens]|uniref:aspartate aminotransferase, mitochondrial-like n=1 Tax=Oppia nitens TaxID=1686743 RepID=UPI0023DC5987|nr:aspartate aminotransferase, mitochondrial-like [Oppia nitens]
MNWFSCVVRAESDKIYGVQEEYVNDKRDNKINLSIGVFRDQNGQSFVPQSVINCEQMLFTKNCSKEYAPIEGFKDFRQSVAKFIYGEDSDVIINERHATVQGLGGTGSLRIGAIFLYELVSVNKTVYIPYQTWSPHNQVFSNSGFQIKHYRYWNQRTLNLDFEGLINDFENMIDYSVVVLHSIAHNPTGIDPTLDQWNQIIDVIQRKKLFPFLDCAYQGFASGDLQRDGVVNTLFAKRVNQMAIAMTFAKNMGLYGDRIGALSIVCQTKQEAHNVLTQLKAIIRPIYSHPPNWGALVVHHLLSDHHLRSQWFIDVNNMYTRIQDIRNQLINELNRLSDGKTNWDFMANQRGMYGFTGFSQTQVFQLKQQFAIYATLDGRINIAVINQNNIKHIAYAMHCIKLQIM